MSDANARETTILTAGDIVFIRDAARGFATLEQSLRERSAAAGVDDVDAHVRKTIALLLRHARAVGEDVNARSYWLDGSKEPPTEQDRLTVAEMRDRSYAVKR